MWEAIKAIFSKNSIATLIIGAILVLLGSVTDITTGKMIYKTPDILGRVILLSIGIILIISSLVFTFLEYKAKRTENEIEKRVERTEKIVSYRTTIRLKHFLTNTALHSHPINYSHLHSSGQQQITAFVENNSDDYWVVKGEHGRNEYDKIGNPVKDKDVIRLEHVNTRKNLHSHLDYPSPLSNQQEVSGFGNDGIGNTDDNWRIDIEGGGIWTENKRVRLIHITTNCSLHSHRIAKSELTSNQQEVTAYSGRDENDFWLAIVISEPI